MATGTVKWFNAEKGYGFIAPDAGGSDLFVHFTAIQGAGYRTLVEGARVEYEAERGPKGPQAAAVFPLGAASSRRSRSARDVRVLAREVADEAFGPSHRPRDDLRELWSKDVARIPGDREWQDWIEVWRLALSRDGELLFGSGGRRQGEENSFTDEAASDEQLRLPDATWRTRRSRGRVNDRVATTSREVPDTRDRSYAGIVSRLEKLRP